MEIQNKENICQFEKTVLDTKMISRTPLRTPLHDINNQAVVNRSVKKTVLSHVSVPESAPRTPTRKPLKPRRSLLVYQDKENQFNDDNTRIAGKEVTKIINNAKHLLCAPDVNVIPATPVCEESTRDNDISVNNTTSDSISRSDDSQIPVNSTTLKFSFDNIEHASHENVEINTEYTDQHFEKCHEVKEGELVQDFDIFVEHEEVLGNDKLMTENLDFMSNNVFRTNDKLPIIDTEEVCDSVIDHTYAGIKCTLCSSTSNTRNEHGTSPMTPSLKTDMETSTEIPSLIETACFPVPRESKDAETMVKTSTNDVSCSPCHSITTEQETMTDPVTPVKVPDTCDVLIQHLIDTVTAACSPLPGIEMSSVACSPVPSQITADVGSSPAFKSETTDTSTMTIATPVKHEIALQAVPNTTSVLCSPLHVFSKDCGVSAVSSQSDVTTNTVIVEHMDQGVDVRPMMTAGSTMTEYILVNSETSMTPVKLLNRKGHRITAEEIRKQHPRTLANKLDTFALEAERYKLEIGKVEKERDRFKSQITELKVVIKEKNKIINDNQGGLEREKTVLKEQYEDEIENLKAKLTATEETNVGLKEEIRGLEMKRTEETDHFVSEIRDLTTKCENLEKQVQDSSEIKSKEMEVLKDEIDKRQNDHQMSSAHNLILELQTELAEYKDLTQSLQLAEKLQNEIHNIVSNNYLKVRAAADRLMNMKRGLDLQRLDVVQQKCENEKKADRLAGEMTEMNDQYDSLKNALETSRSSMMQIESLYESTSADLLCATNQVQMLSKELLTTKLALEESNIVKSTLIQQLEDSQENDKAAVKEINNLQKIYQVKETEFEDFQKCSLDKEKNLHAKINMLKEEKDRLDLLAVNLQRTVDSLNEDIDTLENDLFATREFSSEQASRLVKLDEELTVYNQELNQIKQENMELRDSLAVFRGNQEYLQENIDTTQRELQLKSVKLNNQTAEIKESTYLVVELENKMAGLLQGLRGRSGLEPTKKSVLQSPQSTCKNTALGLSTQKSSKKNLGKDPPTSSRKLRDQSFLSLVIKAAEGQSDSEYESCKSSPSSKSSRSLSPYLDGVLPLEDEMSTICEKLKDRDSIEDSPSAVSRNKLGFSRRSSAFAPVRTGTSAVKYKPGPLDSTIKNVSVMSQSQLEDSNLRLSEQIECIAETFSEIIRCASIIEKASSLSISDLQLENEELCQQLEVSQAAEKSTKDELSLKISELSEAESKIVTLTNNITSLADKIGFYVRQESELNNLKSEILTTKSEKEQLEAEKKILTNQLKEILTAVKGDSVPTGNFARYHSDITTLKLKIQKLKEQLKQREEYNETLAVKASKRMKTLDENWKKAEEEVYKFDQLVDTIRETLINSGLIPKYKDTLGRIIRMIDGFETVSSKPAPLNPVKTALW